MSEPSLLRQLLDRQEIMAVMAAYTRCADLNQPEQQAEVFVQDGRVKYHPGGWIVGRAALVEALPNASSGPQAPSAVTTANYCRSAAPPWR